MKELIFTGLIALLLGSCQRQPASVCRSLAAEETALHYLVDSILPIEGIDTSIIFIDTEMGISELSFKYGICKFYPKTDSIWENAKNEKADDYVYDCRKGRKKKYLKISIKNTPKSGYTTMPCVKSKGVISCDEYIRIFIPRYAKLHSDKYYVEIGLTIDFVELYLLILDENYKLVEWRFRAP